MTPRPPLPPFTLETAKQKVRLAEDAWNTRDPIRVSLAYTEDSSWRNRAEFPVGRGEIVDFLTRKWMRELDYRLIKELWTFAGNRIAEVCDALNATGFGLTLGLHTRIETTVNEVRNGGSVGYRRVYRRIAQPPITHTCP